MSSSRAHALADEPFENEDTMARHPVGNARAASRGERSYTANAAPVSTTTLEPISARESPDAALPHDRDESVGMTGGVQSALVQQAARDLKRCIRDTSRAPESDDAYRTLKK
jgi:hypothetical protein